MKKLVICFCITGFSMLLVSWGIFGHEHINRAAVFAQPVSLQIFFYNHIDFITQESTVPDLRKYTMNDKAEYPRHFFDLDNFGSVDSLPARLEDAKKKYDENFLQTNGTLPWYIGEMMQKLTMAFKEKKKTQILFIAADLGHYLGDAHMPLHTTSNHDGQKTNQKGIHALWEARIPEMFGNSYNYYTREAKYIDDVSKETWRVIISSHKLADTLLFIDKNLRKKFKENELYKTDSNGKLLKAKYAQYVYSDEYSKQLEMALNGMVEKQLRASIMAVSDFWYTAWVNAGRPDLNMLDSEELTNRNSEPLQQELKLWKTGKLSGVESEKEF